MYMPCTGMDSSTKIAPPGGTRVVWILESASLAPSVEQPAHHMEAAGQVRASHAEEDADPLADACVQGVLACEGAHAAVEDHIIRVLITELAKIDCPHSRVGRTILDVELALMTYHSRSTTGRPSGQAADIANLTPQCRALFE